MTSESWFDNWAVEGVDTLADIEDVEVQVRAVSRVIPTLVPFLVPETNNQQIEVIGERDEDEVPEISVQALDGSPPPFPDNTISDICYSLFDFETE